jgi:hypothetical protein
MRAGVIAGVVLIALGAFVLFRGASYRSQHEIVKIGDVKVTANDRKEIPSWVGIVAIVAGAALVVGGARRRSL